MVMNIFISRIVMRLAAWGEFFRDNVNTGNWENDFAFTKDVGRAFVKTYPELVRAKILSWTDAQRQAQDKARSLCEFNSATIVDHIWT